MNSAQHNANQLAAESEMPWFECVGGIACGEVFPLPVDTKEGGPIRINYRHKDLPYTLGLIYRKDHGRGTATFAQNLGIMKHL